MPSITQAKDEGKKEDGEAYGKNQGHKIEPEEEADCKDGSDPEEGRQRSAAFREAPIVEKVLDYLLSEGLEEEFERFAESYADHFLDAARKLDSVEEGPEYTLEHNEIYQKYLNIFEKKIQDFIEENDATIEDFYGQCKTILETDADWDPRRYFIEALMATTEFETFFSMMVGEARIRLLADKTIANDRAEAK